jgi:hypothetical protein
MVIFIQQYLYFRQFKEALPNTAPASKNQSMFQAVFTPFYKEKSWFQRATACDLGYDSASPLG